MTTHPIGKNETFMSEVEKNKHLLTAGDRLYSQSGATFLVTEVHEFGFFCIDEETQEEDAFDFESLQMHWYFIFAQKSTEMMRRERDLDFWISGDEYQECYALA